MLLERSSRRAALLLLGGAAALGCATSPSGGRSAAPTGGTAPSSCIPGTPCVIYDIDLAKGPGPEATHSAGRFTPQGWTPVRWNDRIDWYLPAAAGIRKGYLELEVTSFDPSTMPFVEPPPRPPAPNIRPGTRNQFLAVHETCPSGERRGLSWKLRTGQGYIARVKLELTHPPAPHDLEVEDALPNPGWDPKATYVFRLEWDESSFTWSVGTSRFEFPMARIAEDNHGPLAGVCRISLGETYAQKRTMGALKGALWKSLKIVSLSGPPDDVPRGSRPPAPTAKELGEEPAGATPPGAHAAGATGGGTSPPPPSAR